jgi:hypothetical protein
MGRIEFKNPWAAAGDAMRQYLIEEETRRRQAMLDGLLVQDKMRERARQDNEAARQARLDQQRENEALRRTALEDQDRANAQERQRVLDERFAADQRQKQLDREDAIGNRYLDSERAYAEAGKKREFEASEAAKQRANARYVVDKQMSSGHGKADTIDTRSGTVLDALDELSEKINTQDGALAKVGGLFASAAAKANYDDDVAEYSAVLEGAVPLIARRMGHTGVLTQADVDSVKAMFPKPGDGKSLRDRKIARLRSLMGGSSGSSGSSDSGSPSTDNSWRDHGNGVRVRRKN